MKTAVVGAGAMGSLFGGLLAESGADVWLLDIRKDHVDEIARRGLSIERNGKHRTVRVRATIDPARIGRADLVIVFVKSYATDAAARTAARLAHDRTRALTLQNGMGNAEIIARHFDPRRVLAGTTAHGATFLEPGSIRHAGVGLTRIGTLDQARSEGAAKIAQCFTRAGIQTETAGNIAELLWEKLLVNVGINAITALTGIRNGGVAALEPARTLCRAAVEEAMAVAAAFGVRVRADAVDHVFAVAEATSENRSSMGQDVDNRRPTEIAAINGAVLREARRLGVPAPVNETLAGLVEILQAEF